MVKKQIVVVTPTAALREGLQVLLATLEGVTVTMADEADNVAGRLGRPQPQLLMVAGGDMERTLIALSDQYPAARFLALVDEVQQIDAVRTAGADAVLVQGAPAGHLLDTVRHLLNEHSD